MSIELTTTDTSSHLWRVLSAHFEQRLKTLREKNDSPLLSDAQTAETRGRIAEIKDFLRLGEPKEERLI